MTGLAEPIVEPSWLANHLAEVVVADVRWYLDGRSGRAAYDAGHIPGAVFVDLDADLSEQPGGPRGRHPLASPQRFADAMSRLGIGDGAAVVAYDDTGGMTAGRLVWMLRVLGEHAVVLNGGLRAWEGPLEQRRLEHDPRDLHRSEQRQPGRAGFTARPWPPGQVVDADTVAVLAAASSAVVLDARPAERYRGDSEPIDARPGHIPGAVNAPWAANLDPQTGRFRSRAALRAHYETLGVAAGTEVVASCGSGVSACVDLLGLELAGLGLGKLFDASWSGWAADRSRPAATGSVPGP